MVGRGRYSCPCTHFYSYFFTLALRTLYGPRLHSPRGCTLSVHESRPPSSSSRSPLPPNASLVRRDPLTSYVSPPRNPHPPLPGESSTDSKKFHATFFDVLHTTGVPTPPPLSISNRGLMCRHSRVRDTIGEGRYRS